MNINNDNSRLMTHDLLQLFNNFFNENKETYRCKEFISFDSLLKIISEYGYSPTVFEINDVKGELPEKIDKIYFFVIMGRIVKRMQEPDYIENVRQSFLALDNNKNHMIEMDELHNAFKYYVPNPPSYDEITELFKSLDLNNDGHITFDEFISALTNNK